MASRPTDNDDNTNRPRKNMDRHPTDNLALVFGLAGLILGMFALLHQSGAINLGVAPTAAIAVLVVGIGGVMFGMLELRRR